MLEEYQVERTPSVEEQVEEALKFQPNWGMFFFLLTMMWAMGWHYGYGLDTYNRLKHILQKHYGCSTDDMEYYA